MIVRVIVVASTLNVALLMPLLWPLGIAALVLLAVAATLLITNRRGDETHPKLQMKTPFDLGTALKLAGLIALISLLAKWLIAAVGESALTVLAGISGIADVDAITLSLARLVPREHLGRHRQRKHCHRGRGQHRRSRPECRWGSEPVRRDGSSRPRALLAICAGTAAFMAFG